MTNDFCALHLSAKARRVCACVLNQDGAVERGRGSVGWLGWVSHPPLCPCFHGHTCVGAADGGPCLVLSCFASPTVINFYITQRSHPVVHACVEQTVATAAAAATEQYSVRHLVCFRCFYVYSLVVCRRTREIGACRVEACVCFLLCRVCVCIFALGCACAPPQACRYATPKGAS